MYIQVTDLHLSPLVAYAVVRSKSVVLLLVIHCWLLFSLWESVIVLCFVVRYFIFTLVLQSSWWGRESWLLCFYFCLPSALWLLCGSSLWRHGRVYSCDCGTSWWYSLTIFELRELLYFKSARIRCLYYDF